MKTTTHQKKQENRKGAQWRPRIAALLVMLMMGPQPGWGTEAVWLPPEVAGPVTTADKVMGSTQEPAAAPATSLQSLNSSALVPAALLPDRNLNSSHITDLPRNNQIRVAPGGNKTAIGSVARGVRIYYDTGVGGWGGAGYAFNDFRTPQQEYADFSSHTELILGVRGTNSRIKIELEDRYGNKRHVHLEGIRSDREQVWRIPMSRFAGLDLKNINAILFIVESPELKGTVDVYVKPTGASAVLPVNGLEEKDVTPFSDYQVTRVAPSEDRVTRVDMTSKGLRMDYQTVGGWTGGGFSFDRRDTAEYEVLDLSNRDYLVFGIQGNADRIKMEVVDIHGRRASVYLTGFRSDREQYWRVFRSQLGYELDTSRIAHIFFIAEGNNETGTLQINVRGNTPTLPDGILPDPSLGGSNITALPRRHQIRVTPDGNGTSIGSRARGMEINYDTRVGGWGGGGYVFDSPTTPERELADFSSHRDLILGFQGTASRVKVELEDQYGRKQHVYLTKLDASKEQQWRIPMERFSEIDIAHVKALLFIVEHPDVQGKIQVFVDPTGPQVIVPVLGRTPADVTRLPGKWTVTRVAPSQDRETRVEETAQGFRMDYKTTGGWAGGGFSFDDVNTPAVRETVDLTSVNPMMIGIEGQADRIKLEVVDDQGRRGQVYLGAFRGDKEQYWMIFNSSFGHEVDLTRIAHMFFIAEGNNESGTLKINVGGKGPVIPSVLQPDAGLSPADLQALPETAVNGLKMPTITTISPSEGVTSTALLPRGIRVNYQTGPQGWAGGGLSYDHFGTTQVETFDLSSRDDFRFGITGTLPGMKIEFVDGAGRKQSFRIEGIDPSQEKVWRIPRAWLTGVDLTKIRLIYFIVEQKNGSGSFVVQHKPLEQPSFVPYTTYLGDVSTSKGTVKMYYYNQRSNDIVYFWNTQTNVYTVNHLQTVSQRDQLKAVSSDGSQAVVAGSINRVYLVSLTDNLKYPEWINLPVFNASDDHLEEARYLSPIRLFLRQANGREYHYDLLSDRLTPLN